MAGATFNTLKFANTLKAAGVPEKQAEAEAEALSEALAVNFKDLATKDDLKNELNQLRTELKNDIRETEQRLNARIDGVNSSLNAKIDGVNSSLNAKIDCVNSRIDSSTAKIQGEMTLMKYMFGICITLLVGIIVRLFFVRVP